MQPARQPSKSNKTAGVAFSSVIGGLLALSLLYLIAIAPTLEPFPNTIYPLPLLVKARNTLPLAGLALIGGLWLFSVVALLLRYDRILIPLLGIPLVTALLCGAETYAMQPLFHQFWLTSTEAGGLRYHLVSNMPGGPGTLYVYRCNLDDRECARLGPYSAQNWSSTGYCTAAYQLLVEPGTQKITVNFVGGACPTAPLPTRKPTVTPAAVEMQDFAYLQGMEARRTRLQRWFP